MRTSPIARLLIMGIILMMLNVPLTMMCGVVGERASRRNQVVSEVSGNWGGEQTIGGPVLSVPVPLLVDRFVRTPPELSVLLSLSSRGPGN